jgi:HEAT repeat protein
MSITSDSAQTLLSSPDFGDRIRGVIQLRQLELATAFKLLQPVVVDSNVRVRYAAVCLLASIGQVDLQQSLKLLRVGLQDPEPDVQAAAADAIAALHITEAFDDLQQLYQGSQEWLVRFSIVAALGELGDRRGFEILQEALNSDNDLLVTAAIGSLGELGDPRAVHLLIPYVDTSDWQTRYRVAQALSYFDSPDAKTALGRLAQDSDEKVAGLAQQVLS